MRVAVGWAHNWLTMLQVISQAVAQGRGGGGLRG